MSQLTQGPNPSPAYDQSRERKLADTPSRAFNPSRDRKGAVLNPSPGSSTRRQHQLLVMAGRSQGLDLSELRSMVGGSLCRLSVAECSDWIKRFSGRDLPNPPGQAPRPPRNRHRPGIVRMITDPQIEQITRMAAEYFGHPPLPQGGAGEGFGAWLYRTFKVLNVRELATAKRAAEVIVVLKQMLARRQETADRRQE